MELALFAALAAAGTAGARTLAARRRNVVRTDAASFEARAAHAAPAPYLLPTATAAPAVGGVAPGTAAPSGPLLERFPVMHMRELFSDAQTFESPLVARKWPRNQNFVGDAEEVVVTQALNPHPSASRHPPRAFVSAGPLESLYWDPTTVRAAIVTCGGLCPGLNTVVRELVMCLHYSYGVPPANVLGVVNGYRGFYDAPLKVLTPSVVSAINREGGTILGSSRGGFDLDRILESVQANGINIVFVIGGDGTHRGALQLLKGAVSRKIKLSVACVPKTIDNDIPLIDRSFGFDTAVEQAVHPLTCAHTEALAARNGVGLVKLMGRQSGFIALSASLASRDVNVTLLPEAPWRLSSLLAYLETRLETRGHCLIVVAEGAEAVEAREAREAAATARAVMKSPTATTGAAGASAGPSNGGFAASHGNGADGAHVVSPVPSDTPAPAGLTVKKDESGNPVLEDVGVWLKEQIGAHFKRIGKPLNLKYIDPSYIIRSAPANASDSHLCTTLAFNCVHGAMGGRTGFTVGFVDGAAVWIPISAIATLPPRLVDPEGRMYARMCNFTGQPFLG